MSRRFEIGLIIAALLACACTQENQAESIEITPAPSMPTVPALDERRARFEKRKTVEIPESLPKPWRRFLTTLRARLTRVEILSSTHAQDWRGHRSQVLHFRLFGTKADIESRLMDGFRSLKLPGIENGIPQEPVDAFPVEWSVDLNYLRAPKGSPREARVVLTWSRKAKERDAKERCRKPKPVTVPNGTPKWLMAVTEKRTTRRRIVGESLASPGERGIRIYMLYRNGFAHDEHVGALVTAALRNGFKHVSGSGPRQEYQSPHGALLSWSPVVGDLNLGCRIEGPVLMIDYDEKKP